jgi:hypothetical protein
MEDSASTARRGGATEMLVKEGDDEDPSTVGDRCPDAPPPDPTETAGLSARKNPS